VSYLDPSMMRESASGESDSRQWISYGTVEIETAGAKSVTFTKEYGPLVNVKLHPSGVPVVCRVAHEVAGNGEGEWFPFLGGDEVIVGIPEGDEKAGCVILGRLNQEIDKFPTMVAGQSTNGNNFAFRRLRVPYIFETSASYLLRSAMTKAFLSIDAVGNITLSNADAAFLALTADFLGFQNGDADTLVQIDIEKKQVTMGANGAQMTLDKALSFLYTQGILQFGTAGNKASWHATSIESVVAVLNALFIAVGAATGGITPLTGATLAAAITTALGAGGALQAAAVMPVTPFLSMIQAALSQPMVPGTTPGIGAPGLLIG